jgi:hypothetical protein
MRFTLMAVLAAVAAFAAGVEPSQAQNRRFCTERPIGSWGFPNCAYDTMEQCRATASGTGAYCTSNSWYVEPQKPVKGKKKKASG